MKSIPTRLPCFWICFLAAAAGCSTSDVTEEFPEGLPRRLPKYTRSKRVEPKVQPRFPDKDSLPKAEPFASDADAIEFARSWLQKHYELPEGVSLGPAQVGPAMGGVPEHERDKGICVAFPQFWKEFGTPGYALLYINERTVTDAKVDLHQYTPIPGTERDLIAPAAAKRAWIQLLRASGFKGPRLEELEALMKPRLVLARPVIDDLDDKGNHVYAPNWLIIDNDIMMVDAQTGDLWRNG